MNTQHKLYRQQRVESYPMEDAIVPYREPISNTMVTVKTKEQQRAEAKRKGVISVKLEFKDTHLDQVPLIINPVQGWDQLARDYMNGQGQKLPEFVIYPFGNIRGCPKNILNQFKKQVYRTASEGNGWIVHNGLSDNAQDGQTKTMAGLISEAVRLYKDSVRNPAFTVALVNYHSARSAEKAVDELESNRDKLWFEWPKRPNENRRNDGLQTMVRYASQFIFYEPDIHAHLLENPMMRAFEGATDDATPIYIPSLRILLRGTWDDTEELLKDWEEIKTERPTIIVGDSGGLSEYLRDFLTDTKVQTLDEKTKKYSLLTEMKQYNDLLTEDQLNCEDEDQVEKLQAEVQTRLGFISRFYDEKKIFLWHVDEEQLSEILVKSLHENDKKTKTKVSQIALLNLALYLGCTDEATELFDSDIFDKRSLATALMKALCLGKDGVPIKVIHF